MPKSEFDFLSKFTGSPERALQWQKEAKPMWEKYIKQEPANRRNIYKILSKKRKENYK